MRHFGSLLAVCLFLGAMPAAARWQSPATGLVRDRAPTEDGAVDSVPATGPHCSASPRSAPCRHAWRTPAAVDPDPARAPAVLERLQTLDLLLPCSLVENVFANGTERLPLQAGLNASLEALGAYHLLARADGRPNAIHRAAESQPVVRKAMSVFYPPPVR